MWIDNVLHGPAWGWEKMLRLIEQWKRISGGKPFYLKGIQSVGDARKSVELGVDRVVGSNHAGRQVDAAIASLDALEKIVNGRLHPHHLQRLGSDETRLLAIRRISCLILVSVERPMSSSSCSRSKIRFRRQTMGMGSQH